MPSSLQLVATTCKEQDDDTPHQDRVWNDRLSADSGDFCDVCWLGADLSPDSLPDNGIHDLGRTQVKRMLKLHYLVVMAGGLAACAGPGANSQDGDEQDPLSREQEVERRLEVRQGAYKPLPEAVPEEPQPLIVGEVPGVTITAIKDDLAKKLDIPHDAIEVVMSRSVTWNDGSLGCARPGQIYTQAVVPGYQVILMVEGLRYDYRAAESGYHFLCELPTLPQPSTNL